MICQPHKKQTILSSYTDKSWLFIDLLKKHERNIVLTSRLYTLLPDMQADAKKEIDAINVQLKHVTLYLNELQMCAYATCCEEHLHKYIEGTYRYEVSLARECIKDYLYLPHIMRCHPYIYE